MGLFSASGDRLSRSRRVFLALGILACGSSARADENIFGYIMGAEPLPKGGVELYQIFTSRTDKGAGYYRALDSETEVEYAFTDKLSGFVAIKAQGIDTHDILIDAYIPKDEEYTFRFAGVETALKYNFMSPARKPVGISALLGISVGTLDPHSGQDKDTFQIENLYAFHGYLLDGRIILVGNVGFEATHAKRFPIDDLPPGFEWPTDPEMEIELQAGFGFSWRFAPGWFVGAETWHEREYETEVNLERWSWQAGPTMHYGGKKWWATLTWMPQLKGGGESFPEQDNLDLHLVEKTKQEIRLKVGFNF